MLRPQPGDAAGGEGYSAQLDTLRGLAVSGVLVYHYIPEAWVRVNLGALGVKLFFVLSGYLITLKLLDCRGYMDSGQPLGLTLKRFYARRTLRIFPVYYLALTLSLILGVEGAWSLAGWMFGYATNFYIAITGHWPGPFSPFWTLAVEEQFYLLWPWFILRAPRRGLGPGALLMVAAAPLFRVLAISAGLPPDRAGVLLPACLDTLGIGAATAIAVHPLTGRPQALRRAGPAGAVAALIAATLLALAPPSVYAAGFDVAYGLAMAALVVSAARGVRGWGSRLLDNGPLSALGRVSYGMYVVHAFAPLIVAPALRHWPLVLGGIALAVLLGGVAAYRSGASAGGRALLGLAAGSVTLSAAAILGGRFAILTPAQRDIWVYFGLCWLVSVLLATLSWVGFEEPINRYKRLFPYRAVF